jgi:hypothetical protein
MTNMGTIETTMSTVPSSPVSNKWCLDWACKSCQRYGFIEVEVTGGPRDDRTGKLLPKTTDEQFYRDLELAHREATGGLCVVPMKRLLLSKRLWRWEQRTARKVKIVMVTEAESQKQAQIKYVWPPWLQ